MIFAFLLQSPLSKNVLEGTINGGMYNGYVGIGNNTKLPGNRRLVDIVCVHGGITFDSMIDMESEWMKGKIPITENIPTSGIYRIIGFDTMHAGDTRDYWTIETTITETLYFAEELGTLCALEEMKRLIGIHENKN